MKPRLLSLVCKAFHRPAPPTISPQFSRNHPLFEQSKFLKVLQIIQTHSHISAFFLSCCITVSLPVPTCACLPLVQETARNPLSSGSLPGLCPPSELFLFEVLLCLKQNYIICFLVKHYRDGIRMSHELTSQLDSEQLEEGFMFSTSFSLADRPSTSKAPKNNHF